MSANATAFGLRSRSKVWAATWATAGLLTLPLWKYAIYAFALFPAALCFTFGFNPSRESLLWILVLPYVFYFSITAIALSTTKLRVFWVMEIILCFTLLLNVIGCYLGAKFAFDHLEH